MKELTMRALPVSLVLSQFMPGGSNSSGWVALIVILALLLAGGIYLIVHSFIDFRRDRSALKREEESDKRKAA